METFKGKIVITLQGGQTFEKKSKSSAVFSKYDECAREIVKKLKKERKQYMVTIVNEETGETKSQFRSKLFTN